MKKIIEFLMNNWLTSTVISLIVYIFYGLVIGVSMIPSALLIYEFVKYVGLNDIKTIILLSITIGIAIYLFFIVALIVFGVVE